MGDGGGRGGEPHRRVGGDNGTAVRGGVGEGRAGGALRRVAWQRSTERLRGRELGYTKRGLEKSTA